MQRTRTRYLAALAGYIALALVYTWPLVTRLSTHVIGPFLGDNFEYVWKMWWVPHALFEQRVSPFIVPNIAYPTGYALASGEITPVHTFFLAPLTFVLGEITVYNLSVLLSVVLSGWFTYLLLDHWLTSQDCDGDTPRPPGLLWAGAFFAGAAFAVSPYRMQRIAGHLPLIDTQWLVLAVFALDSWIIRRRRRDAALTGLAIGLAALSSWYYGMMLAVLLPVYALVRIRQTAAARPLSHTWQGAGTIALVTGALCIPFLTPYLNLFSEGATAVPLADASFWAFSPLEYLLPNPTHPLWGQAIQAILWPFSGGEMPVEFATASSAWAVLLLALLAWRRTSGGRWRALKWVIGIAFLLSLGPQLHLGRLNLGIALPPMLLRQFPVFDSLRSWGRFSIFVTLGLCLLAGAGLVYSTRRMKARAAWLLVLSLTGLMLFESWNGPARLVEVAPRAVDLWLAEQPEDAAIMQYPIDAALSGPAMLYTRYHGKPVVYGYGTYFPFEFKARYPELMRFPDDSALDRLQTWGVHFVLVETDRLPGNAFTLEDIAAQPRLEHVITLEDQAVYALKD